MVLYKGTMRVGDRVWLRPVEESLYPSLARLILDQYGSGPFLVRMSYLDSYGEFVRVRWPAGTKSGALYATLFLKDR